MRSANAIKVHRKSGEAERRDLRFRGPFLEMFFDRNVAEWRALPRRAVGPAVLLCRPPPNPGTTALDH
jgi:hypothetical protein